MICLKCKTETKYNRAVVTLADNEICGGFCETCEEQVYGQELQVAPFKQLEGCLKCPEPAVAAFPEHTIEISIQTDMEYETEGYPVHEDTPRVCSEHLPVQAARQLGGSGPVDVGSSIERF